MSIRTVALRGALAASAVLLGSWGGVHIADGATGALTYMGRYAEAAILGRLRGRSGHPTGSTCT